MTRALRDSLLFLRLATSGTRHSDRVELTAALVRALATWALRGRAAFHVRRWVTIDFEGIRYSIPPRDNSFASAAPGLGNSVVVPEAYRLLGRGGPGVFVDVGANLGYVCMPLARRFPEKRVIAIEPLPWLAEALEKTAALNGFRNLTVIGRAIGPGSSIDLAVPVLTGVRYSTLSSYAAPAEGELGGSALERFTVPAVGLDDLLRALGIDPSSVVGMKVDVEGAEIDVLKTALAALRCGPPLIFEALDRERRETIEALLKPLGYGDARSLDRTNFVAMRR